MLLYTDLAGVHSDGYSNEYANWTDHDRHKQPLHYCVSDYYEGGMRINTINSNMLAARP